MQKKRPSQVVSIEPMHCNERKSAIGIRSDFKSQNYIFILNVSNLPFKVAQSAVSEISTHHTVSDSLPSIMNRKISNKTKESRQVCEMIPINSL